VGVLLAVLAIPVVLAGLAFWFVQRTTDAAAAELVLRIGGTVAGCLGGVVFSFAAVILSNFMIGKYHTPIGPLIAIGGNIVIVLFTYSVTGHRMLAALPGVAWFLTTIVLSQRGPGSDLLLQGNWVGVLTLLGGSLAWGISAYQVIDRHRTRPIDAARPAPSARVPESVARPDRDVDDA